MAIPAGSFDRRANLGRNMGARQQWCIGSFGPVRPAQHRSDRQDEQDNWNYAKYLLHLPLEPRRELDNARFVCLRAEVLQTSCSIRVYVVGVIEDVKEVSGEP